MTKPKTIGEKFGKDMWVLYDDPASLDEWKRKKEAERSSFVRHMQDGWSPEKAFPHEPELRAEYSAFLQEEALATLNREDHLKVAWPPFAQKLASVLEKLVEDQFLFVSVKHSDQCVLFAAQGSFGLRVETTSNSNLTKSEQLTERQIANLIDAGWNVPTGTPADAAPENDPDGSPNFFVEFAVPVSCEAVANLAVRTLSEILSVPHPAFLQYQAIDDTEGNWKAMALPDLGLKLETPVQQTDRPEQPQEQEPQPFTGFVPLSSRDLLIAELKKEYPGITDEQLEAYGGVP
jgi:hypothetical protein